MKEWYGSGWVARAEWRADAPAMPGRPARFSLQIMPSVPSHGLATPSWPVITPPIAPREPHEIRQLGRARVDAYAWMRFIPPSGTRTLDNLPPRLRGHLDAETRYARDLLGPLEPAARWFRERLAAGAPDVREPAAGASGGWRYHAGLPEGGSHRVFSRTGADGRTQRLLDEAVRAEGHAYYRATDHQPSPDGRYFAWAEDVIGDDRHRICLLDIDSGAIRILVASDAFGYGGFTFSPSSRHLFWIWRDEHSRPTRLYRSPVEGGEPVLVHEERDSAIFMRVARTAADRFVTLTLAGPDTGEVRLIPAGAETDPPRTVRPRRRGVRYEVDEWNGALLMLTDADGAIDRKLLRLDPVSFTVRDELVPHRAGVPIIAVPALRRGAGPAGARAGPASSRADACRRAGNPDRFRRARLLHRACRFPAIWRKAGAHHAPDAGQPAALGGRGPGERPAACGGTSRSARFRSRRVPRRAPGGAGARRGNGSRYRAVPQGCEGAPAPAADGLRRLRHRPGTGFLLAGGRAGRCRVPVRHRARARRIREGRALVPGRMPRAQAQFHDRFHRVRAPSGGDRPCGTRPDRGPRRVGRWAAGVRRDE